MPIPAQSTEVAYSNKRVKERVGYGMGRLEWVGKEKRCRDQVRRVGHGIRCGGMPLGQDNRHISPEDQRYMGGQKVIWAQRTVLYP